MARVMIAQWDNECISLSVLSEARVMIAQWENECISLSVLSVARIFFPVMVEFLRNFSLADHTLPTRPEPVGQKMAQSPFNGTTKPVDSEEESWNPTTDTRTDNGWETKDGNTKRPFPLFTHSPVGVLLPLTWLDDSLPDPYCNFRYRILSQGNIT